MSGEVIVQVPKKLDFMNTMRFVPQITSLPRDMVVIFDFEEVNFVGPFGFVLVSAVVRDLVGSMTGGKVFVRNHRKHTYHAHMGFFQAFGVDFGNVPGAAKGSGSYLPITIEKVIEIQRDAVQSGRAIGEVVEEKAMRLAKVLASQGEGELVDTFTYSLREIIRNVAEHSKSAIVEYCAQYWPTQDRAEIVILDRGVGIAETLKNNPYLKIESVQHAINLSLLPGVSGKGFKGAKQNTKGGWHNSGYGLYMTSRMCRHGGNFFIGSHSAAVLLIGEKKKYFEFNFPGTVVRMVFRPSEVGKIRSALARFDKEGQEISATIAGTVVTASSASKMLSSDFKER